MILTNLSNSLSQTGIKEVWNSEEKDFSPFIAEHLDEISNIIGIQFGEHELEKRVGRYESDIVVDILDDLSDEPNSVAIIENKIGQFDHDHLGKCLTYGANIKGKEAKVFIWICDDYYD